MEDKDSLSAVDDTASASALSSPQIRTRQNVIADQVHAQNPTYTPIPFIAGLAPAIYMLVFGGVNATQTQRIWIESFFRRSSL